MSERLDKAIQDAKHAVAAYNEQREKAARELKGWQEAPTIVPTEDTDAAAFLKYAIECNRRSNAFCTESDRRRELLVVARNRLDAAHALWLEETGLPGSLDL